MVDAVRLGSLRSAQAVAYLESLTELHKISHTLIHLVLHYSLFLLQQPVTLIGNEVTESGKGISSPLIIFPSITDPEDSLMRHYLSACRSRRGRLLALFSSSAIWATD